MSTLACIVASPRHHWHDLVQPKEHGSWSLVLEPIVLGLLVAPSTAGAWLSAAAVAGFLARRPLKIALREDDSRRALAATLTLALLLFAVVIAAACALAIADFSEPVWLLPSALAGAVFLYFDSRNSGREAAAEIAGAAAFAALTPALAIAAHWPAAAAGTLGFVMLARSVPTVMFVRACVRGGKTGRYRPAPSLVAASLALLGGILFAVLGLTSIAVPLALAALLARAADRLVQPARRLQARMLGLQEVAFGAAYVVLLALTWPR